MLLRPTRFRTILTLAFLSVLFGLSSDTLFGQQVKKTTHRGSVRRSPAPVRLTSSEAPVLEEYAEATEPQSVEVDAGVIVGEYCERSAGELWALRGLQTQGEHGFCLPCELSTLGRKPLFSAGNTWCTAEYLMWWTKAADTPVLATTSAVGTAQSQAGVLGQGTSSSLFGADPIATGAHDGGRFTLGTWLDEDNRMLGLQGSFLFLGSNGTNFNADSSNFPILAQPFLNAQTGVQDSALLAFPGSQTGQIAIQLRNEVQAADLVLRQVLTRNQHEERSFIGGYRYARLAEELNVSGHTTYTDPNSLIPVGTVMDIADQFRAVNEFHGAEFGVLRKAQNREWQLDLAAKFGIGNVHSVARVNGSTLTNTPGQPLASNIGGLLALPTNIGTYTQDRFSIQPEFNVTASYRWTPRLRCSIGYTLIYWSQVARPGQLVDNNLNPSQFPPGTLSGTAAPKFSFSNTDFWTQGVNFGLAYHF